MLGNQNSATLNLPENIFVKKLTQKVKIVKESFKKTENYYL